MIKNRLKILLAERDLNYTQLSKRTGISINALSKMGKNGGTGAKQVTYEVLEKLCKALNCSVGELLVYIPEEK
ncbi:helix-turn-helix transcriptional regulator [Candidatus Aerophobetes bacterium]|nr:helix-turn-helix transcriptional regulator [Candidatus Aerophobetes bacterium]